MKYGFHTFYKKLHNPKMCSSHIPPKKPKLKMECFQSENMKARDIEWLKEEKKLAQHIEKNIIGSF